MRKIQLLSAISLLFLLISILKPVKVEADELAEIEKKLSDLKHAMELSVNATTPLEKNLDKLEKNLESLRQNITKAESDINIKKQKTKEGEKLLIVAQELLSQKVQKHYKSGFGSTAQFYSFLFTQNLSDAVRQIGYQKKLIESDRDTIVRVVIYIKELEEKRRALENELSRLGAIKKETDSQAEFLAKEIKNAKRYQTELSSQIAKLSERQKELLEQKFASLNLPVSLGGGPLFCTDDRKRDPGFSPAFAFFTYGIPHRVGLNQYGALGRAQSGQNYKDILKAYYNNINFEKKDPNMKIRVSGYGEKKLDEYLLGIYEMPESWPIEALKAQVVAARSYALAYTNNGVGEICTTQACQVYKGGNKGGNWEKAVKETEGEVITSNGGIVKAWFASTFGGYTFTSADVWGSETSWTKRMKDTKGDINSYSDLLDRAYDKDSPCFYAAQGFRTEYNKSAWLRENEVADIINVLVLAKADSGTQKHLSQIDKSNPDGVETWGMERVKQELKNRGKNPYNSITSLSTDWDKNLGKTNNLIVDGDGGRMTFDGSEFKSYFNLRAPANIQIVGPLYNIERR